MACDTCRSLVARNEELEAEVANLKAALYNVEWEPPRELRLTKSEKIVLRLLFTRGERFTPHWLLRDALYGHRDDNVEGSNIIQVFVSKVRCKLRPFGLSIETGWAQGFRLSPESRTRLLHWPVPEIKAA